MTQNADWLVIEVAYRAGFPSVRKIAQEHGITEAAIRKKAKKEGWLRDPEGTKRQLVRAAMAGGGSQKGSQSGTQTDKEVREAIESEAGMDIVDMHNGLVAARQCIRKLRLMIEKANDPRDVKIIAEANRISIDIIRRIRGLDEQPANASPIDDAMVKLRQIGMELMR